MYEQSHQWYSSRNNDRQVVLYSTVDRPRVGEEDKSKDQPRAVRKVRTVRRTREPALRQQGSMQGRSGASADQGREGAQKTGPEGARVLRDQIYPVKVDNASRVAVLDQEGEVLLVAAAAEVLEKNEVNTARIVWLSRIYWGETIHVNGCLCKEQ